MINQNGLSEISFSLKPIANNILKTIIKLLYEKLIKIVGNKKIFLITRFKYADSSMRSLHKGIIITVDDNITNNLFNFINKTLAYKSNDYDIERSEIAITHIIFNFFIIPKDSDEKYSPPPSAGGGEDINTENKVQELAKFKFNEHNYFFPLNRDYAKWGMVVTPEGSDQLIVSVNFNNINGLVKVERSNNKQNEISYIVGDRTLITFSDIEFNDSIFIRVFKSGDRKAAT